MPKEVELNNIDDLNYFAYEFDKIYDLKEIILLGREAGVRRIILSDDKKRMG